MIYTLLARVRGSTSSALILSHSSANFLSRNLLWIPSREENMILFSPRLEISRRLLLPEISFLTERRHVAVVDEQQRTSFEDLTNYKCSNVSAAPPTPTQVLNEENERRTQTLRQYPGVYLLSGIFLNILLSLRAEPLFRWPCSLLMRSYWEPLPSPSSHQLQLACHAEYQGLIFSPCEIWNAHRFCVQVETRNCSHLHREGL